MIWIFIFALPDRRQIEIGVFHPVAEEFKDQMRKGEGIAMILDLFDGGELEQFLKNEERNLVF